MVNKHRLIHERHRGTAVSAACLAVERKDNGKLFSTKIEERTISLSFTKWKKNVKSFSGRLIDELK